MTTKASLPLIAVQAQEMIIGHRDDGDPYDLRESLESLVEELDSEDKVEVFKYAVASLLIQFDKTPFEYGSIKNFSPIDHLLDAISNSLRESIIRSLATEIGLKKGDELYHKMTEYSFEPVDQEEAESRLEERKEYLAKLIESLQRTHDAL